jgi:hypothetical protein
MADWLVLEDFAGNIGGPRSTQIVGAGTLLDDIIYNIPALLADGLPLIPYNPATMAAPLTAFRKQDPGPANIAPDGNLLALLVSFGSLTANVEGVFNVKNFGARGDGVTVDDAAFQLWLAALSVNGGTGYIPPGIYRLTKQLQGPQSGVAPIGTGITPTVASTLTDHLFYEVEIQTIGGAGGTLRYKSHPDKAYDASGVAFAFNVSVPMAPNPASITIPPGVVVGNRFQWRGAGSASMPWKSITLVGGGRENTILDFDFTSSGGVGDGIVVFWDTDSNSQSGFRMADFQLRNLSATNKCGTSAIVSGGGAPAGFSKAGSPTGALDRYRVEIVGAGGLGVATFRATRNNGAAFPLYPIAQLVPLSGVTEIPGSGMTLTFPAAVFAPGNFWEFEATGYGGSAILNVGGTLNEYERLFSVGFKVGATLDANLTSRVIDSAFITGVLTPAADQIVGVLLTNANLYFNRAATFATNIISVLGGVLHGRFAILDWGGVVHHYSEIDISACHTPFFFGAANALRIEEIYADNMIVSFCEADWFGTIDGLSFGHCYIANQGAKPFLFNHGASILNFDIEVITETGNPNGTTGIPEFGLTAAQNNAQIRSAGSLLLTGELENSTLPFVGGLLFDTDPSLGGRYMGSDAGLFSRHGINVFGQRVSATLHVRRLDPAIPAFQVDRLAAFGIIPFFQVEADAQGTVLSTGIGATGLGPRGRLNRERRATTSAGAPFVIDGGAIPAKQGGDVIVTSVAISIAAPARIGVWKQAATFLNYLGGPAAIQVGVTALETGYPRTTAGLLLAAPVIAVNGAGTGFAVTLANGGEPDGFQWTVTFEYDQGGDGGVV